MNRLLEYLAESVVAVEFTGPARAYLDSVTDREVFDHWLDSKATLYPQAATYRECLRTGYLQPILDSFRFFDGVVVKVQEEAHEPNVGVPG